VHLFFLSQKGGSKTALHQFLTIFNGCIFVNNALNFQTSHNLFIFMFISILLTCPTVHPDHASCRFSILQALLEKLHQHQTQWFGGILAKQLVLKASEFGERRREQLMVRMNYLGSGMGVFMSSQELGKYVDDDDDNEDDNGDCGIAVAEDGEISTISGIGGGNVKSDNDAGGSNIVRSDKLDVMSKKKKRGRNAMLVESMVDRLGNVHQAIKNPWKLQANGGGRMGKGYTPAYPCCLNRCKKRSRVHCYQCNKVFCFSSINDVEGNGSAEMNVSDNESCFSKYVHQIRRKSSS
jgi:hypothetical protein